MATDHHHEALGFAAAAQAAGPDEGAQLAAIGQIHATLELVHAAATAAATLAEIRIELAALRQGIAADDQPVPYLLDEPDGDDHGDGLPLADLRVTSATGATGRIVSSLNATTIGITWDDGTTGYYPASYLHVTLTTDGPTAEHTMPEPADHGDGGETPLITTGRRVTGILGKASGGVIVSEPDADRIVHVNWDKGAAGRYQLDSLSFAGEAAVPTTEGKTAWREDGERRLADDILDAWGRLDPSDLGNRVALAADASRVAMEALLDGTR